MLFRFITYRLSVYLFINKIKPTYVPITKHPISNPVNVLECYSLYSWKILGKVCKNREIKKVEKWKIIKMNPWESFFLFFLFIFYGTKLWKMKLAMRIFINLINDWNLILCILKLFGVGFELKFQYSSSYFPAGWMLKVQLEKSFSKHIYILGI